MARLRGREDRGTASAQARGGEGHLPLTLLAFFFFAAAGFFLATAKCVFLRRVGKCV